MATATNSHFSLDWQCVRLSFSLTTSSSVWSRPHHIVASTPFHANSHSSSELFSFHQPHFRKGGISYIVFLNPWYLIKVFCWRNPTRPLTCLKSATLGRSFTFSPARVHSLSAQSGLKQQNLWILNRTREFNFAGISVQCITRIVPQIVRITR